jgi:hypothetical protein
LGTCCRGECRGNHECKQRCRGAELCNRPHLDFSSSVVNAIGNSSAFAVFDKKHVEILLLRNREENGRGVLIRTEAWTQVNVNYAGLIAREPWQHEIIHRSKRFADDSYQMVCTRSVIRDVGSSEHTLATDGILMARATDSKSIRSRYPTICRGNGARPAEVGPTPYRFPSLCARRRWAPLRPRPRKPLYRIQEWGIFIRF